MMRLKLRKSFYLHSLTFHSAHLYWEMCAQQLSLLIGHYRERHRRIKAMSKQLWAKAGKRPQDHRKYWHRACERVLGRDWFAVGNQMTWAINVYCVALYQPFAAALKLLGEPPLDDLAGRHPEWKRMSSFRDLRELALVYHALLQGRESLAARQLRRLKPRYFGTVDFRFPGEPSGNKATNLTAIFGNLEVTHGDFKRYLRALNTFTRVVEKAPL